MASSILKILLIIFSRDSCDRRTLSFAGLETGITGFWYLSQKRRYVFLVLLPLHSLVVGLEFNVRSKIRLPCSPGICYIR